MSQMANGPLWMLAFEKGLRRKGPLRNLFWMSVPFPVVYLIGNNRRLAANVSAEDDDDSMDRLNWCRRPLYQLE